MVEEKINEEEPLEDQIILALKKIKFAKNPWSSNFYITYQNYDYGLKNYD
jgi:hypothetical protein